MKISQSDLLAQTELSASTQKLATEKKRKKERSIYAKESWKVLIPIY